MQHWYCGQSLLSFISRRHICLLNCEALPKVLPQDRHCTVLLFGLSLTGWTTMGVGPLLLDPCWVGSLLDTGVTMGNLMGVVGSPLVPCGICKTQIPPLGTLVIFYRKCNEMTTTTHVLILTGYIYWNISLCDTWNIYFICKNIMPPNLIKCSTKPHAKNRYPNIGSS